MTNLKNSSRENRHKPYLMFLFLLTLSLPERVSGQGIDNFSVFLGFRLGVHYDSLPHTTYKNKFQKLYRHVPGYGSDTLHFEKAKLKSVNLYFFKDKLHSIDIKTEGEKNSAILIEKFKFLFGPGEVLASFDSRIAWNGEKYSLSFEQNLVTKDSFFSFVDIETDIAYQTYLRKLESPGAVD